MEAKNIIWQDFSLNGKNISRPTNLGNYNILYEINKRDNYYHLTEIGREIYSYPNLDVVKEAANQALNKLALAVRK